MIAFQPAIIDDPVIRINPRVCGMLDGDFDGDTAIVYAPSSPEAQRQAAEMISVAGYARAPIQLCGQLNGLVSRPHSMLWGIVELSRTEAGRAQIQAVLGPETGQIDSKWTYNAEIDRLFQATVPDADDLGTFLSTLDQLKDLAFKASKSSGVSMHPFLGESLALPDPPDSHDAALWDVYRGEVIGMMASATDPDDDDLGTLNVFRFSGCRGSDQQFFMYLGGHGPVGAADDCVYVKHGFRDGLTVDELFARARQTHREFAKANLEVMRMGMPYLALIRAHGVLARARRSPKPGVVIARAASRGETDPLTDVEAKLLTGIA